LFFFRSSSILPFCPSLPFPSLSFS
jgi:hypothetical protein